MIYIYLICLEKFSIFVDEFEEIEPKQIYKK